MNIPQAVLFDLDGTLLDTVPDLVYSLNLLRQDQGLSDIPVSSIRGIANLGSRAMIKCAFDIKDNDPQLPALREKFLDLYHQHPANFTQFFPNIDKVLQHLNHRDIPWGIVTNKPTRHTDVLLKALKIDHLPHCIVCGDSLSKAKPHPEPILHACKQLNIHPNECLFVGDAATDVQARKAAGTRSLVALYGYIAMTDDPYSWKADGYVHEPIEIIEWLEK
jgi:phosphoglycolate phosphatase